MACSKPERIISKITIPIHSLGSADLASAQHEFVGTTRSLRSVTQLLSSISSHPGTGLPERLSPGREPAFNFTHWIQVRRIKSGLMRPDLKVLRLASTNHRNESASRGKSNLMNLHRVVWNQRSHSLLNQFAAVIWKNIRI